MKGGKQQGSSSLSILNIPPMLLPTPQCECEAITGPSTLMAAGAEGNTSCSSRGANVNVGYLQFKRTRLSCKLDEYNVMARNDLLGGFFTECLFAATGIHRRSSSSGQGFRKILVLLICRILSLNLPSRFIRALLPQRGQACSYKAFHHDEKNRLHFPLIQLPREPLTT